ncbi:MAG: hypothetical protein R3E98_12825 [Gemmatimonadota bacterium]
MGVTAEKIDRLREIFAANGWDIGGDEAVANRFDRMVNLMSHLEPPAQELLMHLTSDFLVQTFPEYGSRTSELVAILLNQHYERGRDGPLIVLPMMKDWSSGEPKSGAMITYLVRAELKRRQIPHHSWDRAHLVRERLPSRCNALIFIVDDFIGSGDTALAACTNFSAQFANDTDQVLVGALVAQEAGLSSLRNAGVKACSVIVRRRGISDSSTLPNITEALSTMDGIETLMNVPGTYKRGFRRSEALVSLVRCPNNTFPVYWKTPTGEVGWIPPFDR